MIRSVEIEGLRGIQKGELRDLSPLTILVGQNNSGKSTILEALLIGASPLTGQSVDYLTRRRRGLNSGTRWLLWKAGREGRAQVLLTTDQKRTRRVLLTPQATDTTLIQIEGQVVDGVIGEDFANSLLFMVSDRGSSTDPTTPHPLPGVEEIRFVGQSPAQPLAPLYEVYSVVREQGRRKEIQTLLTEIIPGLESVDILTDGDLPVIYLDYGSYAVPIALAGDGIQALLRLALELAARPNGVVLLEEPEVHQHPGALRQSARAIHAAVRRGVQVILTTHSLDLIDLLLSEVETQQDLDSMSVYHLLLQEGCLKSSRTAGSDIAFARAQIGDDLR